MITTEDLKLLRFCVEAQTRKFPNLTDEAFGIAIYGIVRKPLEPDERGAGPLLWRRAQWAVADTLSERRHEEKRRKRFEDNAEEVVDVLMRAYEHDELPDELVAELRRLRGDDLDLVIQTVAGDETLSAWAERNDVTVTRACRRRQAIVERLRAAVLTKDAAISPCDRGAG